MMRIRVFFTALAVLFLFGCGTLSELTKNDPSEQTVEGLLGNPEFQRENEPIRILNVLVFYDESLGDADVRGAFTSASFMLERQVGIVLDPVFIGRANWTPRSYDELFRELRKLRKGQPAYDLVVGVVPRSGLPDDACVPGNCIGGQVNEWRNIGLRSLWPEVIVHEIGHTFMVLETHSLHGVMTSKIENSYFTRRDREVVLRNKWRDFRRKPNIIERCFSFC